MTPKQRKLARHALGLPNRDRRSYRNRFVAAYAPGDYDEWAKMVDAGLAECHGTYQRTAGANAVAFWLTHAGARAALEPGESLDPEDFPE